MGTVYDERATMLPGGRAMYFTWKIDSANVTYFEVFGFGSTHIVIISFLSIQSYLV